MSSTPQYKEVIEVLPAPMKGVNMISSPNLLAADEAVDIRGYEFQEYGVIGTPWSHTDLSQIVASQTCLSAHVFQREGAATQLIVHMSDGTLRYSTNFLTAGSATWTTIASGLSTTAPFSFVTYLDTVFMTNGVNDYRKWDGATQTTYSSVPKMKYLAVWKDVVWGAGETTYPHRVRSSDPGDGSTWPALNFVDVEKGRGWGITGLAAVVNELVVFKLLGTFGIYDPVEFTNRIVDKDKGSVSHFGIVSHNGLLYFVSHQGVCLYLGDAPSQVISDRIAPVFDDIRNATTPTTLIRDYASESKVYACSFENHIDFMIPTLSGANTFQIYPEYPERPWLKSGFRGEVAVSVREKDRQQQQYEIVSGKLWRRYDNRTTAAPCLWYSSWVNFDSPIDEKYMHTVVVMARGRFDMFAFRDYNLNESAEAEDSTGAIGTNLGDNTAHGLLKEATVYTDSYGRCFQICIKSSTVTDLDQYIASGDSAPVAINRFSSAISRVVLRARVLGEGWR